MRPVVNHRGCSHCTVDAETVVHPRHCHTPIGISVGLDSCSSKMTKVFARDRIDRKQRQSRNVRNSHTEAEKPDSRPQSPRVAWPTRVELKLFGRPFDFLGDRREWRHLEWVSRNYVCGRGKVSAVVKLGEAVPERRETDKALYMSLAMMCLVRFPLRSGREMVG